MELHDLLDIRSEKEVRHPGLSNRLIWLSLVKVRGEERVFQERK